MIELAALVWFGLVLTAFLLMGPAEAQYYERLARSGVPLKRRTEISATPATVVESLRMIRATLVGRVPAEVEPFRNAYRRRLLLLAAALFLGWLPAAVVSSPTPSTFPLSPVMGTAFLAITVLSIFAAIRDEGHSIGSRLLRIAVAVGTTMVALRLLTA